MAGTDGGVSVRFASAPAPRVSVVVTGWKQSPYLLACLSSIAGSRPATTFEVIVSLNEPTDDLLDVIAHKTSGVALLTSFVNRGFGGACNGAARQASGEFIVLLNDDAEVQPGWLDMLVDAADANPMAAAVGGRLVGPDGTSQEDGTVLWSDGSVTLVDHYHQPYPRPAPGIRRVDYCSAASLLVRKAAWDQVGGFDEGYFPAYYEDVDLCMKLHATGREVLLQPASVASHRHGASTHVRYRHFLRDRNQGRLVRRWSHALSGQLPPALEDPVAIGRAVQAARERPPRQGPGPLIADEVISNDAHEADDFYLRRELDVVHAYASALESDLAAAQGAADERPFRRVASLARAGVRRSGVAPTIRRSMAIRRSRGRAGEA